MMPVLSIKQLSFKINKLPLLNDINLDIASEEIVAILGPNGAGKTSLLNVITGELSASKGEVFINGHINHHWSRAEQARLMAVLPQHSLLSFPFSVTEVVNLGRTPHDTGLKRDEEICMAALKAVDALHLRSRVYTQLSGGEKQRVQLARVLAQIWEPDPAGKRLLILDEPTSSLDLAHQQQILMAITGLAKQGCAIVIVLHDINLAARFADKILLLNGGRIAAQGTPEQVLQPAVIKGVFDVDVHIIRHPETGVPVVI
jgi:heme transport system ATP-binding protein